MNTSEVLEAAKQLPTIIAEKMEGIPLYWSDTDAVEIKEATCVARM